MILSISRSRESLWVWLFWSLGVYLALELGSFFIAGMILKTNMTELVGPYLAVAAPWVVFAPIIWWLRKREEQRASPKRLARIWGLSVALFCVTEIAAIVYLGAVLHLLRVTADLIATVLVLLFSVPILYFVTYFQALRVISARAFLAHFVEH